jgi:ElaB/YqjD/DUF883 family membrane-anchored ribosome-binding protein
MTMNSQKVVKNAAENAHAGTDAVSGMAHDLVDNLAGHAEHLEENVRKGARMAEKKVKESIDTVRETGMTLSQSVSEFVRNHPFASIGIAVGLGLAVSALSKRNDSAE